MKNGISQLFGRRLHELRKQHGWSQPDLGKKIGTSGTIIGRYERGEMTPSIEVARKLADVFGVTVDSLVANRGGPDILKSPEMLARWEAIDELPDEDRQRILFVVDGLIRDARARQAYGGASHAAR
jgi:transcriptional regulator with XRE-family HTH domain